jgi:hypothetical protein
MGNSERREEYAAPLAIPKQLSSWAATMAQRISQKLRTKMLGSTMMFLSAATATEIG